MSTCRLCKNYGGVTFKYGVRHYAHAHCAFKKWGGAFLGMIPQHQIGQLPYRAIIDAGLLAQAERLQKETQ